ncbi:MAG: hypothetical protein GF311_16850 [Candidatus Lokiarchaeota archaeon]|nr:hypothetical protein [Candidatus Lokiarchaeota archaeon]
MGIEAMSQHKVKEKTQDLSDHLEKEAQDVFDLFEGYTLLRRDYSRLDKRNVIEAYIDFRREKLCK